MEQANFIAAIFLEVQAIRMRTRSNIDHTEHHVFPWKEDGSLPEIDEDALRQPGQAAYSASTDIALSEVVSTILSAQGFAAAGGNLSRPMARLVAERLCGLESDKENRLVNEWFQFGSLELPGQQEIIEEKSWAPKL